MSFFRHPYSGGSTVDVGPAPFKHSSALGSLLEYIGSACYRFEDVMTEPERPWLEHVTKNIPTWHDYLSEQSLGLHAERLGCDLAFIVYDHEKRYHVLEDYVGLFLTPEPSVSVLESDWLEPRRMLSGEQPGSVARWFRRFSWDRAHKLTGPEEHIGLETSFCGWLYDRAADRAGAPLSGPDDDRVLRASRNSGLNGGQTPLLGDLTAFVLEHYGQWAPDCFTRLSEQAATDYWRNLLQLGAILAQRLYDICQDPDCGKFI